MILVQKNVDLSNFNTLALKSVCSDYVIIDHIDQIEQAAEYAKQHKLNIFILSGGSNLLLPEYFEALTLHIDLKGQNILDQDQNHVILKVAAGETWHDFVCKCCENGYHGLENLALIPGRVGAAPIQNIGAYGVEVGEFIEQIWAYDLIDQKHVTLEAHDCQFAYRDSIFKKNSGRYLIYSVSFKLNKIPELKLNYADIAARVGDFPTPQKLLDSIIFIREQKLPQPKQYPNAGSFFKNPVLSAEQFANFIQKFPQAPHYPQPEDTTKVAAGWLIEQTGWKGKKLGIVGMFERQALVLVNYGDASLSDVQNTYQQVQQDVYTKFSIRLEPEPVLLNQHGKVQAHGF